MVQGDGSVAIMFRRNYEDYLISQIPRFTLSLDNLEDLSYFDEIIDVRGKEDYFCDHIVQPGVKVYHETPPPPPPSLLFR